MPIARPVIAKTFVSPAASQVRSALLFSLLLMAASLNALAQNIGVSPASLTFAKTIVGVTSASKSVTVTNNGASAQAVNFGMSGDFSETDNCGGSIAGGGGSCTVKISFTPTLTGAISGATSIYDNSNNLLTFVGLTGSGAAAVAIAPTSLNFGAVTIGTLSAAKTFKITNDAGANINGHHGEQRLRNQYRHLFDGGYRPQEVLYGERAGAAHVGHRRWRDHHYRQCTQRYTSDTRSFRDWDGWFDYPDLTQQNHSYLQSGDGRRQCLSDHHDHQHQW
jgi:hypothetical protein